MTVVNALKWPLVIAIGVCVVTWASCSVLKSYAPVDTETELREACLQLANKGCYARCMDKFTTCINRLKVN